MFGVVTTPAILTVSEAEAQTTTAPAAPTVPPTTHPSREPSAVRSGEPGEPNGARDAEPGTATRAAAYRTRRATRRARRHQHYPHRAKKVVVHSGRLRNRAALGAGPGSPYAGSAVDNVIEIKMSPALLGEIKQRAKEQKLLLSDAIRIWVKGSVNAEGIGLS